MLSQFARSSCKVSEEILFLDRGPFAQLQHYDYSQEMDRFWWTFRSLSCSISLQLLTVGWCINVSRPQ